jgi:hypothetical protein
MEESAVSIGFHGYHIGIGGCLTFPFFKETSAYFVLFAVIQNEIAVLVISNHTYRLKGDSCSEFRNIKQDAVGTSAVCRLFRFKDIGKIPFFRVTVNKFYKIDYPVATRRDTIPHNKNSLIILDLTGYCRDSYGTPPSWWLYIIKSRQDASVPLNTISYTITKISRLQLHDR